MLTEMDVAYPKAACLADAGAMADMAEVMATEVMVRVREQDIPRAARTRLIDALHELASAVYELEEAHGIARADVSIFGEPFPIIRR